VADFIGETNFLAGQVKAGQTGKAVVLVDGELEIHVSVERTVGRNEDVTVAIRPEKISVHAESPDQRAVPGTVEEVIYTGTDTRYLVRLTKNTIVTVRQQNVGVGTSIGFSVGALVYLAWQPESARLLTA
jgi:spermidine/putrescine transport system ATP-binding protein